MSLAEAIRRVAAAPPTPLAGQVARRLLADEAEAYDDPAARASRQRAQIGLLAEHFARTSPAFAERLTAAGLTAADLAEEGGLARLPIAGRRDFQIAPERLYASVIPREHHPLGTSNSSGSTGEPVFIRRTMPTQVAWLANTMRLHLWHATDLTMRYAVMRAKLDRPVHAASWGAPADWFGTTGALLAAPNGVPIEEQARTLREFAPELLAAYPSVLMALIDEDVAPPRALRTIGEALSPEQRQAIEARWGVGIVDIYSSEEVGYLGLPCPDADSYHVPAETLLVEIVDAGGHAVAPGREGRVIVTDLLNFATPVIRYDIGDRAVRGEPCRCGRTLPTLGRIMGRERNLILMPDGTRHWPFIGRAQYRAAAPVRQFQLAQVARDRIEVRLVTERPLTQAEEAALAAIIADALGHRFAFDFRYHADRLPRGANGKLEEFVCLLT